MILNFTLESASALTITQKPVTIVLDMVKDMARVVARDMVREVARNMVRVVARKMASILAETM